MRGVDTSSAATRNVVASRLLGILVLAGFLAPAFAAGNTVNLEHVGSYTHGELDARHVVGVEGVLEHHALVSSPRTLCLVDLEPIGTGVEQTCIGRVNNVDATTTVTGPDGYTYVNLRRGGTRIVRIDQPSLTLTTVGELSESGVYYERMALDGDRLFVTAHAYGLRIFDVTDPEQPTLVGTLPDGFADAWAVDVDGDRAYVADGAGGLKIVDVSNASLPAILAGEDVQSAPGTAMDVRVIGDWVYVASGGAGVAVYSRNDLSDRRVYDTPTSAEYFAVLDGRLAVADTNGVVVYRIEADGGLTPIAGESGKLRQHDDVVALRLWHGVGSWGTDRLVVAGWSTLDVYELVPMESGVTPDITASRQRVRFAGDGGTTNIVVRNEGSPPLQLTETTSSEPAFSGSLGETTTLASGETTTLQVSYDGSGAGQGLVLVGSDDPDEAPLPFQVFGRTPYLDPGEAAIPFTLEAWTFDHATRQFSTSTFNLADQAGKVVYFYVFSTGCPDCLPAVSDIQNSIGKRFQYDPRVVVAVMSQAEPSDLLTTFWSNVFLRVPMIYDPWGSIAHDAYGQPEASACSAACSTVLPASRGIIIGPDQSVVLPIFGHDPDRVVTTIEMLLQDIPLPGDVNGNGAIEPNDEVWLNLCYTGADQGPPGPGCNTADLDGDGDVDCDDWAWLSAAWTNPEPPSGFAPCVPGPGPAELTVRDTDAGTLINWSGGVAVPYDALRGELAAVRPTRFTVQLGSVICLEAASTDGSTAGHEDHELPLPGQAFFYLVVPHDRPSRLIGNDTAGRARLPTGDTCRE